MPMNHVTHLLVSIAPGFDHKRLSDLLISGETVSQHPTNAAACKIIGAIALKNNPEGPFATISSSLLCIHGNHWNKEEIDEGTIAIPDHAIELPWSFCRDLAETISSGKTKPHAFVIIEFDRALYAVDCDGSQLVLRDLMNKTTLRSLTTPDLRP